MRLPGSNLGLRHALEGGLSSFDFSSCKLDPHAAAVIERLSRGGQSVSADIEAVRKQYVLNRTPLLGRREDVAKIIHVQGSGEAVPSLTVFHPLGAMPERHLPALVYLHGGGWSLGGLDTYEPVLRQLANATGRVVVWVDYRLAPEHPFPAALEDSWNALEWVTENAAWLGIDKDQIAIGGDSAGGNLAAVTALAARDGLVRVVPQFQLLIYPCLDLTARQPSHDELASGYLLTRQLYAWYRSNYIGEFPDPTDWHLSPLFADDLAGVAPAVVLYAGLDPLRDEAARYCARLADAGVAVAPIFFPGMIHGFITMGGAIPAANEAIRRVASAIKEREQIAATQPPVFGRDTIPREDRVVLRLCPGRRPFARDRTSLTGDDTY